MQHELHRSLEDRGYLGMQLTQVSRHGASTRSTPPFTGWRDATCDKEPPMHRTAARISILTAALAFVVLMIVAATYPALILHKGFINLGSGLPFFDERTDDAT